MRETILETPHARNILPWAPAATPATREKLMRLAALGAVVLLAAGLRCANLAKLGYVNHYYSASVTAMLQSWHNFFFVAAEPGGSVTVDKPPVGLWLQALSARVLGVNTLGVLLPQLVAGVLSVILLYHLVRRSFGTAAGLLAALALAITPVVVATDRNNTIDSTLILTLLLAAWAFIKATESGRLRYLLLGAGLVGIGFNIKMLQAFLPLPAFYALYVFGAPQRLLPKIGRLALATLVLLAVSLSWVAIVDLTPASQRPYVGSSEGNSELNLIVGYNGLQRLLGMGTRPAGAGILPQRDGGFQPRGGFGGAPGGFPGTGRAGPLRLFIPPLSKEASWLLPFGLFGALLVAARYRPRWPLALQHRVIVLWGGWLLVAGAFFSVANFFHEYYLSMLGAPLAALVGLGVAEFWRLQQERRWLALALLLPAAGVTLVLQLATAQAFVNAAWWRPLLFGLFLYGALLLLLARRQWPRLASAGFGCLIAALLILPAVWSGLSTLNSSGNQSLPAAYDGRSSGPANRGALQVNQTLLDYLTPRTQGMKFLMAVPSSMQGADYVLATGRPVLYLGGFMGQDQVASAADLARLVAAGELRYIYWDGRNGGRGGFSRQSDISAWVTSACAPVDGYNTDTRNAGAPDGTAPLGGSQPQGFGSLQVTLYDCAP